MPLLSSTDFSRSTFSKKSFRNNTSVSNGLDPDQGRHYVGPDLGLICLQRLSADESSLARNRERSGSVVECLTRDRRAAGSSLTGVTALWSLSKTHLF